MVRNTWFFACTLRVLQGHGASCLQSDNVKTTAKKCIPIWMMLPPRLNGSTIAIASWTGAVPPHPRFVLVKPPFLGWPFYPGVLSVCTPISDGQISMSDTTVPTSAAACAMDHGGFAWPHGFGAPRFRVGLCGTGVQPAWMGQKLLNMSCNQFFFPIF